MMITLYTECFFDSAHFIESHPWKCANLHGHTWKVGVWVKGDSELRDKTGILWDFGNLKTITEDLDHKNLNNILSDKVKSILTDKKVKILTIDANKIVNK